MDRHRADAVPVAAGRSPANASASTTSRAIRGCSAIYEDRERNLWIGSQTESLFRLWNGWARRVSQRDGLTDPFVWSIARDQHGRMLIGTNSNVSFVDASGVHELVAGKSLPNPAAYELFVDDRNRIWIGTRGGVAIYADQKVERPAALKPLDAYQINAIVQNGPDDFWIGTTGGLYRYRGDTLTLVGPPPGGTRARVRSLYRDATNDAAGRHRSRRARSAQQRDGDAGVGRAVRRPFRQRDRAAARRRASALATLDAGFGVLVDGKLSVVTRAERIAERQRLEFPRRQRLAVRVRHRRRVARAARHAARRRPRRSARSMRK